jgi:DNA repair exonuclease SbcCD ATPase subunit
MDLTQLSQMVAWLDEEHRRDREEIAKLDQRLQSMAVERQEQARRIQDLEGRLASTHAQLTRFTQIEQALQQLKNEVVVLLDKQTEARLHAERESERARLSDREALTRGVAEIRKELPRLGRIEEELVTRKAEEQRLAEMLLALRQSVSNVSKDLDERTRSLPYVMEQRAQDNKRIAQLQAENMELTKRTDSLASRLPAQEERLQRLDKELSRIQPIPEQLRQDQQSFIEAQKLAEVDRQRQMGQWEQEFTQQRSAIERQSVRLREFEATHEAANRALKALEEFQAQIVQGQKQTAELQRLAEERQRKELAEWQSENEQRWKKETLRWDYALGEQNKINQKLLERFPPIEKQISHLYREIEALWRLQEAAGNTQLSGLQKLLDVIGSAIDARPKQES